MQEHCPHSTTWWAEPESRLVENLNVGRTQKAIVSRSIILPIAERNGSTAVLLLLVVFNFVRFAGSTNFSLSGFGSSIGSVKLLKFRYDRFPGGVLWTSSCLRKSCLPFLLCALALVFSNCKYVVCYAINVICTWTLKFSASTQLDYENKLKWFSLHD